MLFTPGGPGGVVSVSPTCSQRILDACLPAMVLWPRFFGEGPGAASGSASAGGAGCSPPGLAGGRSAVDVKLRGRWGHAGLAGAGGAVFISQGALRRW
jgi:hypothetical protein